MRSFWPSPSESKSLSTQTSPLIQSAVLAENTFWASPLTNVGTAGAGSGAGAALAPGTVMPLGGIGFAYATPPASAIVTVIAPAEARRLPISIRDPSLGPCFAEQSASPQRGEATVIRREACGDLSTLL